MLVVGKLRVVTFMERLSLLIMSWALAACTFNSSVADPPKYAFVVEDNPTLQRFDVKLVSNDSRKLCLTSEDWPSSYGDVSDGDIRLMLTYEGGSVKGKMFSFGYAPHGFSSYVIEKRSPLIGIISYASFDSSVQITQLPNKSLQLMLDVGVCTRQELRHQYREETK